MIRSKFFPLACLGIILCVGAPLLTFWSWTEWKAAWIDRSDDFFPPEFASNSESVFEKWEYPIYRSNDTYQWAYLAKSINEGNDSVLFHRFDEGPMTNGRSNAWHSGLSRMLDYFGSKFAKMTGWPEKRGILYTAHWLGSVIGWLSLLVGSTLIYRLSGSKQAITFSFLFFFNAAIQWDFAFSRLDHEAVFQLAFLLQVLGIAGIFLRHTDSSRQRTIWPILAGLGSGLCWWISSTMQVAVGFLIVVSMVMHRFFRSEKEDASADSAVASNLIIWGLTGTSFIALFLYLDHRATWSISIASLHPIFLFTHLGAALFTASLYRKIDRLGFSLVITGALLGLFPAIWIAIHGTGTHPWLDPVMRRLHDHIAEFRSPFANQTWKTSLFIHAIISVGAALFFCIKRFRSTVFLLSMLCGMLLLACLQTRWLGLLASLSVCSLCLQTIRRKKVENSVYLGVGSIIALSWAWQWSKLERNPGRIFVTDMILQVGARDLNLNLSQLAGDREIEVVIPYAFASTSALFEKVRPLGTFYWENQEGITAVAEIYSNTNSGDAKKQLLEYGIDFIAVQSAELSGPLAELVAWTIKAAPPSNQDFCLRLAHSNNLPEWLFPSEFKGTFDPRINSFKIYAIGTNDSGLK